jgi:hypothetical protein
MTTTTASVAAANFPNQQLTPFATSSAPPTFSSLQLLQLELNENAASVHSIEGGGLYGHLCLTITNAEYLICATVPFVVPVAPPAAPLIAIGATAAAITEATRQRQDDIKNFALYHDTDKALLRQIVAVCPAVYLTALRDPVYGYGPTTTLQMLTHLRTTYGTLTIIDCNNNLR